MTSNAGEKAESIAPIAQLEQEFAHHTKLMPGVRYSRTYTLTAALRLPVVENARIIREVKMPVENITRDNVLAKRDVKPSGFVHVVLKTARFKEQVHFYKIILNAKEVMGNEEMSFLTYDQEHHRIAIANFKEMPDLDPQAAGVDHFAYAFSSLGYLLANYIRLKSEGIQPYWCINHGPTTSLYYRDHDGNQVELQNDNFDTHEELIHFFDTDAFRANPLGVQFDPDRLVELYRAGRSEDELKQQGVAPREPGTEYVLGI